MVRCPNCGKNLNNPQKTWTYGVFKVDFYSCNCDTEFREYTRDGKHSFMLKLEKGKGYVKA
jgi:hypothetical protein